MPSISTEFRVIEREQVAFGGHAKFGALIDARIQTALENWQDIANISLEFSKEDWRAMLDAFHDISRKK